MQRSDRARQAAWVVAAVASVALAVLHPVGVVPPEGKPMPWVTVINGLPLALLPALLVLHAYWPLRTREVEVLGATSRPIGAGFSFPSLVVMMSLPPAVYIARADVALGALTLALFTGGSWLMLEGQRRLRRPMGQGEWTDEHLDGLRPNVECIPVGGIWIAAFLVGALITDGPERVFWVEAAVVTGSLVAFLVLRSLLIGEVLKEAPIRAIASLYWVVAVVIMFSPNELLRLGYVIVGTPIVAVALERERRRRVTGRVRVLVESGLGPKLLRRYGPALQPPIFRASPQPVDLDDEQRDEPTPQRASPVPEGPVRVLSALDLNVPLFATLLVPIVGSAAMLFAMRLGLAPLLALVWGGALVLGGWVLAIMAVSRRVHRIGVVVEGDSLTISGTDGTRVLAVRDVQFVARPFGPLETYAVVADDEVLSIPGLWFRRWARKPGMRWQVVGTPSWSNVHFDGTPDGLARCVASVGQGAD